jgi:histone-lysine N-methyltransferase SETD3
MARWLEAAGADLSRVALRPSGGGEWEVIARKAIRRGERVLTIPRRCIVVKDGDALARFLTAEQVNRRSSWRPLVDALPRRFPHHPYFFTSSDLALLEGSFVHEEVLTHEGPPPWAHLAVISRNFLIHVDGGASFALIPFADMLQHSDPPETTWGMEGETFVMTALRSFKAGTPIHDNYGSKSNSELLLTYGFCDAGNRRDEARVSVGGRRFSAVPDLSDARMRDLLGFARLIHLDEPCNPNRLLVPVSLESEAMAVDALAFAAREALARFPTTIAEDAALLTRRLTTNARNAVLARMSEKRALIWLEQFASAVLPRLRCDRDRFVDAVASRSFPPGPFDTYLSAVALGISRVR